VPRIPSGHLTERGRTMVRTAVVTGADIAAVRRFLPSNYRASETADGGVIVIGEDSAGWTLDGYVIPRLASGLISAREIRW
jgi:hypothetical protein